MRRANAKVASGNLRLVRILTAEDVEFVFPGTGAFAQHSTTRAELLDWLLRRIALAPDLTITDVVVSGTPWSMRIAMSFVEKIGEDYSIEGLERVVVRGLRVRSIRVYMDTEVVAAWESRHPEVGAVSEIAAR